MISITELSAAWDKIVPHPSQNVGRRADDSHPLDFFITYDESHNMQMILVAESLPTVPASSQQISVRANPRQDGKYALCFSLADKRLKEQYVSLCWDIMDCTYNIPNKRNGVKMAINRFCLWQKLFAEAKDKQLSDAEVKGLIGELCVLKHVVLLKHTPRVALAGWVGPMGADRDFEMPDTWYEVKAISLSKDIVSISSLDQLDTDNQGELLIARIEKVSQYTSGSFTLNSLIDDMRNGLDDWETRTIFESRIASTKYDCADPRSEESYILHQIETYKVDNNFPRIRRSKVSSGVSNATYDLSISGLQNWRQS